MSLYKLHHFTSEEMQEEINKRNERALSYEKTVKLLTTTFNNFKSLDGGSYFKCWKRPDKSTSSSGNWEIIVNERNACECCYNYQTHEWSVSVGKYGLCYDKVSADHLINIVYDAIRRWTDNEIKRMEKLKTLTIPTVSKRQPSQIPSEIPALPIATPRETYDERHEKYIKEQEEKKKDFGYYSDLIKKTFDTQPFELITGRSMISDDTTGVHFVYSLHIKFNDKNLCSCSYNNKINKWTITNDGQHWNPCDPKDLIEKIKIHINNYFDLQLEEVSKHFEKCVKETTLLTDVKFLLK